jgi:hypothetical protein
MSCGFCGYSLEKLLAFKIPFDSNQRCRGQYEDVNGQLCVCNSLLSKHRSDLPRGIYVKLGKFR